MSNIRNGYRKSSVGGDSLKDPMVEQEFEAAEVLAGMLNSSALAAEEKELNEDEDDSTRECGDCVGHNDESNGTWGSKGKRSNKRVRSESPPVDSVEAAENDKSVVSPLHFDADQAEATSQQAIAPAEEYRDAVMVEEKNIEFPGPSPQCQSSQVTGGKGRKNLSEAEKEARKLKRVLANRESARQTIRRRQALYEELRRKVADLMKENENLKKEKHSAVDEYTALKSSNKNLNDQVTKVSEAKLEHNHRGKGALASNSCYSPFPFPNFPHFMCQEGWPFFWPSHVNPSHLGDSGGAVILSPQKDGNKPANHTCFNCSNDEQEVPPFTFSGLEGSGGPWCIMQCPWLMPLPTARSSSPNLIQFLPTKDDQVDDNILPTKTSTSVVDSHPSGIAVDLNTQCFGLYETSTIDTNKSCYNVFGSLDGLHLENENNSFPLCDTTENHLDADLSKDVQFSVNETKKTETAAMEARRRRRKELMRLKNLHSRPSRKAECW